MRVEDIKLMYEYNEWANNRILDAAEKVSPAQLTQPNELGWGSLMGGLVHILDAEFGWFNRLFDRGDGEWLKAEDFSDLAALRERWQQQNEITQSCLDTLKDGDLTRVHTSSGGERDYHWVMWQALAHVVNHGTQHRSECAALLTGFGSSPGDMDFTLFLGSRGITLSEADKINREHIELLWRYNDWANDRIIDCAEQVSSEQLSAANDFGWGSLRGALVHLMDAEYAWRVLLKDGLHIEELQPENYRNVASIRARWADEREAFWAYFDGLSDKDLSGTISYEAREGMRYRVLCHCLAHVVNHGTQHRSECAALLTGFGRSPGNLDLSQFLLDEGLV